MSHPMNHSMSHSTSHSIGIHGQSFRCRSGHSVLQAMSDAGKALLRIGCRSGGCGICRVRVLAGRFHTGVMSAAQVSADERRDGYALACKLYPDSDLQLIAASRTAGAAP